MNNRRKLVIALGAGAFAAPFCSFAQQQGKVWRIGFLGVALASGYVKEIDAIRAGLRELGYVEGRNISIEYRWAESNPERLKDMAEELVALKVDVIITHSILGVRAAGQATKTIPIVMADGADPVAAGLVASLARPGGNITGSTAFQTELAAKRLELLKDAMPRLKSVSFLFNLNPLNPNQEGYLRETEIAAKQMKIELSRFAVKGTEDLPGVFSAMATKRIEAAVIGEGPFLNTSVGAISALAASHRLPAIGITIFADAGGLLGYGVNRQLHYGRAAIFVDKIIKGAKPGDIPIERATKFEMVVNLKTAKALGITIPQSILVRADRVIE